MSPPTQTDIGASLNALRNFARVNGIAEDIAVETYERELQQVGAGARIERFVAIIAEKHAKDALRSRARPRYAPSADTWKAA